MLIFDQRILSLHLGGGEQDLNKRVSDVGLVASVSSSVLLQVRHSFAFLSG